MILPTMTDDEIHENIVHDFNLISQRYLDRLGMEYDKTRRKNRIPKEAAFPKYFEFRTPAKNNWMILFSKAPAEDHYKGADSQNVCSLVYYAIGEKARVFKIMPQDNGRGIKGLSVYNAHLFSRYNERMNLDIMKLLDKVKHFFIHNGYSYGQAYKEGDIYYILSKCHDGIMLGDIQNKGRWAVYKTFIPANFAFPNQLDEADRLLLDLQKKLEADLQSTEWDKFAFQYKADVLKSIT